MEERQKPNKPQSLTLARPELRRGQFDNAAEADLLTWLTSETLQKVKQENPKS